MGVAHLRNSAFYRTVSAVGYDLDDRSTNARDHEKCSARRFARFDTVGARGILNQSRYRHGLLHNKSDAVYEKICVLMEDRFHAARRDVRPLPGGRLGIDT